jgi:hypothetical protein
VTLEQAHPEPVFGLAEGTADRRLCEVKAGGGCGGGARGREGHDQLQVTDLELGTPLRWCECWLRGPSNAFHSSII